MWVYGARPKHSSCSWCHAVFDVVKRSSNDSPTFSRITSLPLGNSHYCLSACGITLTHWGRNQVDAIFADIFICILENENEWISPRISLTFVPKVRINNIPVLVQIMAWRRPGDKPLSEPMMVSLLTHISVTRTQWVKEYDTQWIWYEPIVKHQYMTKNYSGLKFKWVYCTNHMELLIRYISCDAWTACDWSSRFQYIR